MYRTPHAAARVLHINDTTIRTTLYRIRQRYDRATSFLDEYSKYKREMPLRKYL